MKTSDRNELDAIRKRLASHLAVAGRKYPRAWRQLDQLRAGRKELGDWPAWCFCPLHGSHSIVLAEVGKDAMNPVPTGVEATDLRSPILDVARVGCLGAWRTSQGIYWIDEPLRDAILETPCDKEIPTEVLFEMPQWCVYIPLPGHEIVEGEEIHGFFAHLDYNQNPERTELRLAVDYVEEPFYSLKTDILHIYRGETLDQAFQRCLAECERNAARVLGSPTIAYKSIQMVKKMGSKRLEPLMSCLLYLCSKTAEYRAEGDRETSTPNRPAEKKTKDGWRFFPPDKPKVWYVGERLGEAIENARRQESQHTGARAGPRPHVRRAHWHTYWIGGKKSTDRHPELRWLPPFAVALAKDDNGQRIPNQQDQA